MSNGSVSSSDAAAIDYVDWPILGDEEALPADPMAALDKLTQLNGSSASAGAHACGAVSLVGAVLALSVGLSRHTERSRIMRWWFTVVIAEWMEESITRSSNI
jgi:hypothetical protein